jgi:hypothetical protein
MLSATSRRARRFQIRKRHGVAVNYVMEFDNIETIKRSVEVGIGLSILPETAVASEVRSGLLAALGFREGTFTRDWNYSPQRQNVLTRRASFYRVVTRGEREAIAGFQLANLRLLSRLDLGWAVTGLAVAGFFCFIAMLKNDSVVGRDLMGV